MYNKEFSSLKLAIHTVNMRFKRSKPNANKNNTNNTKHNSRITSVLSIGLLLNK